MEIKNRLVVVESIYHQSINEQPDCFEARYERAVESDEQPYRRTIQVTPKWQTLDCGWIDSCGMLCIQNVAHTWNTNPTTEERDEYAARVVELAFNGGPDTWLILPGETFRGMPSNTNALMIRCQYKTARVNLFILPR